MLEISESAAEILERAYEAAQRFNPDARVRIYRIGNRVETGFADSVGPEEEVIEHEGMILFVEKGIEGVLEVSLEHDRLIVR